MFSNNIYVDGLISDAKYVFQYCKNVEVHNAKIVTKDSFWECENVTVYDSDLNGEYLAWHSKKCKNLCVVISAANNHCAILMGLYWKIVLSMRRATVHLKIAVI